ncbi:MAG: hypothetical protein ACI4J0_00755 [Huintestinicola sp.]|uniref:hypothetical protein n=1 Tax=Huintestinicola sp. TaxID=2981661 RepID=UPI003F073518
MRKLIDITSVLCGIIAIASLILGIRVLTGHGYYMGLAIFSMVRQGTMLGFIGNIIGIAITCGGFGAMGFYGFTSYRSSSSRKNAFIWGLIMSAICLVSLFCSIFAHRFNFGDILILAVPLLYTYGIFKSA